MAATEPVEPAKEWGLPDWWDAEAYGNTSVWKFDRWRWEFFRRREDLRQCFDLYAEQTFLHWSKFSGKPGFPNAHLAPHERGFASIVGEENVKRFGYVNLPNPRIGDQPLELIAPNVRDSRLLSLPLGFEADGESAVTSLLEIAALEFTPEQAEFLTKHLSAIGARPESEYTVSFDLDRPLEPQIKTAQRNLKFHQEERHGKKLQRRRNPEKWLSYLRVLDAREAEASWSEITNLFFAQGVMDRRTSSSGGYCAPPPQAARDMWTAADRLRTNF